MAVKDIRRTDSWKIEKMMQEMLYWKREAKKDGSNEVVLLQYGQ